MSDLRTSLERASAQFPAPEMPVERVLRRRDRRQRNRRIGTGIAASAIAIVAFAVAARVLDLADSTAPAGPTGNEIVVFDDGRLVALSPDGSDSRVLIDDPFEAPYCAPDRGCQVNDHFAWSPDGRLLAFQAGVPVDSASVGVYTATPDGQVAAFLGACSGAAATGCSQLAWSPDATRVAYASSSAVLVFDASTGTLISNILCCLPQGAPVTSPQAPAWSPDGAQVAFVATDRSGAQGLAVAGTSEQPEYATFLVEPSSGPLVNGPVSWSPDGSTILYTTRRSSSEQREGVFAVDVASGERTELLDLGLNQAVRGASFTPDGRSIVVTTIDGGGCVSPGCPFGVTISTMHLDGSDLRAVYESGCCTTASTESVFTGPTISPDSAAVAFSIVFDGDRSADSGVYVVNLDGTDLHRIATTGIAPAWQPS